MFDGTPIAFCTTTSLRSESTVILDLPRTISLVDMIMDYFTDINLRVYHNCIADTIRGNGTINISQFTACTTDYSEISQGSIAFVGMAIVIAISFICHNIMVRRELNSIDDKLNKK